MKKFKRIFTSVLILGLILSINPITAVAQNEYDSGTVSIDTQWSSTLENEIVSVLGITDLATITTLNITAGELTDVDVSWLTANLTGLQNLSITGDAYFTTESDGVTAILPEGAFGNYSSMGYIGELENLISVVIDIDDSYQLNFGSSAFDSCHFLQSVSIPEAVSFAKWAFYTDIVLTGVNLPNATTFTDTSFYNCDALTSISLPNATTFGNNSFSNCDNAITLTLGTTLPTVSGSSFVAGTSGPLLGKIMIPEDVVSAYDAVDGSSDGLWYLWTIEGCSTQNSITGFSISGQVSSVIDVENNTIKVVMPYGSDLTGLIPTITLSEAATISPLSSVKQNFSTSVIYKVTSEYGSTREYTVIVTVQGQQTATPTSATNTTNATITTPVNTVNNAVKTGDHNAALLFLGVIIVSTSSIVLIVRKRRLSNIEV